MKQSGASGGPCPSCWKLWPQDQLPSQPGVNRVIISGDGGRRPRPGPSEGGSWAWVLCPYSSWAGPALPCWLPPRVHLSPGFEAGGGVPTDPVQAVPLSPLRKPPGAYQGGLHSSMLLPGHTWDRLSARDVQPCGGPARPPATVSQPHKRWGRGTASELRGAPHPAKF